MSDHTDQIAAEAADTIFPMRGSERWHHAYNAVKAAVEKAEQSGFRRGLTFYERNQKTGEILLRADEKLERGGISQEAFDKIDFPWADHA